MRSGEHKVARAYVLYREERARVRAEQVETNSVVVPEIASPISVLEEDGRTTPLDVKRIRTVIFEACEQLSDVDADRILEESLRNMYDGISATDVATSIIITARTLVEEEPNYTYVSARLLLDELRTEALTFLDIDSSGEQQRATQSQMQFVYPQALRIFINKGVELELLNPNLQDYDLAELGRALKPERDQNFSYLGLQTLYDRYFIHHDEIRL